MFIHKMYQDSYFDLTLLRKKREELYNIYANKVIKGEKYDQYEASQQASEQGI